MDWLGSYVDVFSSWLGGKFVHRLPSVNAAAVEKGFKVTAKVHFSHLKRVLTFKIVVSGVGARWTSWL